jgi:YidC/Oxa1 family membrane protein insertase
VPGSDSLDLAFRLYTNNGDSGFNPDQYIEYVYHFTGSDYMIGYTLNIVGLEDILASNTNSLNLSWHTELYRQEKSVDRFNGTTIYYMYYNDEVKYLSETKDDQKALTTRVKWVSFKERFFCSTLIAGDYFNNADVRIFTEQNKSDRYNRSAWAEIGIPYSRARVQSVPMRFYFGPLKYNLIRKYHLALEHQIPLGWSFFLLAWINRYAVIPVFDFLSRFGWNYGIIILILTILLKIVLLPIAFKTYTSTAKMRVLKPEIDEISKKFPKKEDAMKKQQATMALYKQAGVNPMAGCIPMLLQFPILVALFRFFPSSIELRQQPFLWAHDLSSYDSILNLPFNIPFYGNHVSLFCLLMTISTIIYTRINDKMMSPGQQQVPGMKVMMYMMPVLFLGFFNSYAAALSYYYFLANIFTFVQMFLFRRFVNEEKIHQRLQENRKKTVKKSGFQKRLEEMARSRGYTPRH